MKVVALFSVFASLLSFAAADCSAEADQTIMFSESYLQNVWHCGRENGREERAAQCLQALGLSVPCASCYAKLTQCSRDNCARYCIKGRTPECSECGRHNCGLALKECAKTESIPKRLLRKEGKEEDVFDHMELHI